MRDAHQSLLATRFRTHDLAAIAPYYASLVPNLFSVECWGGATFDVAMRFLQRMPVGAPARVARGDAEPAAADAAALGERGRLHELSRQRRALLRRAGGARPASTCSASSTRSTGSRTCASRSTRCASRASCARRRSATPAISPIRARPSTTSSTTSRWRASLKRAGAHILGIKDMAGLCQPRAAYTLVKALKEEIGLPIHFHTHDTSGIAAASVLAAIDAGADAVDGALDSMSGLTSQPNLGSIVEALRHGPRDTGVERRESAHAVRLLGAGAALLRGVRERPALRRVRGLRARHARRPVHEPARAGALARHRRHALAGSGARLRAGERDVRRHRQGDADLEGRRRHGAADGDERAHARAGARSAHADRVSRNPWSRCSAATSASRTAASRRRCRRKCSRARSR